MSKEIYKYEKDGEVLVYLCTDSIENQTVLSEDWNKAYSQKSNKEDVLTLIEAEL